MKSCIRVIVKTETVPMKLKETYLKKVGDNVYNIDIPTTINDNQLVSMIHFLENCEIADNNCYLVLSNEVSVIKRLLVVLERYGHIFFKLTSTRLKYSEHIKTKKDFRKVHKFDLEQLGTYLLEQPLSELISIQGKNIVFTCGDYERLIIVFKLYKNIVKKLIKSLTQHTINDIISYEKLLEHIDYYNTFSKKVINKYYDNEFMEKVLNFKISDVNCNYKYDKK